MRVKIALGLKHDPAEEVLNKKPPTLSLVPLVSASPNTTLGERIITLRKFLRMSTQEFSATTGLNEKLLIKIELEIDELKHDELLAITKIWPEFACYLISGRVDVPQRNPEVEKLAKKLKISASKNGVLITEKVHKRWFKNGTQ